MSPHIHVPDRVIVTHQHPDLDALMSVWLLQQYGGLQYCGIAFVNTGNPDSDLIANAAAVVDTGKVFDPAILRFDHHQLPGKSANATCAALQVYNYIAYSLEQPIMHLKPLVDLVYQGDTGKPEANPSHILGLHALLSAHYLIPGVNDFTAAAFMFDLFSMLDRRLFAQSEAVKMLDQHTVYTSADGKIVALKDAPIGTSGAAFNAGAELVLFQSQFPTDEGISYAIGMQRNAEVDQPDCGALVRQIKKLGIDALMMQELEGWYTHPAGFFAGRGTAEAPCLYPALIDLVELAIFVHRAWDR